MTIQWNQSYETGLCEVDRQHQVLMGIINRFGEQLFQQGEVNWNSVDATLMEAASYASYHFREEEALMAAVGIDSNYQQAHQQLHRDYLDEVNRMHAALSPDNPENAERLFNFLMHWLVYHILGADQVMARQVRAVQNGASAEAARKMARQVTDSATGPVLASLKELVHIISERNRELLELNASLEAKVTERTRELSLANQQLENMALTDVLTGLPNRRHAMRRLALLWDEALANAWPLSVMMIDADGFKPINDAYGHDAGDQVLTELARALRDHLRNDDVVCRLGGDEFFVLCPRTRLSDALRVAQNLRENIDALRVPVGDGCWHGSVSVGVAERQQLASAEALVKMADEAVYAAKRGGRNRVETMQAL